MAYPAKRHPKGGYVIDDSALRPPPKSRRSRLLGLARRMVGFVTGRRGPLWRWIWDREFDSLVRDGWGP